MPVGQFLIETMWDGPHVHAHVLARQTEEEDDDMALSPTIPYTPFHTPLAKQR